MELLLKLGFLSFILSIITIVDFRTRKIPDLATAALALGGLVATLIDDVSAYAIGIICLSSAAYFIFFWTVRKLHFLTTRRIGLGFGDVKLAGAMGIWLPIGFLPAFIAIAAILALCVILGLYISIKLDVKRYKIPFAPFMCLSFICIWTVSVSYFNLDFFNELSYIR